jgi:hypothetical protein
MVSPYVNSRNNCDSIDKKLSTGKIAASRERKRKLWEKGEGRREKGEG